MRSLGLIGLVLALLIVGVLVKKQMNSVMPAAAPQSGAPAPTARAQSQQIQQQMREQKAGEIIDGEAQFVTVPAGLPRGALVL